MRKRLRFWLVTMILALVGQTPLFVNAQNPQTIEVGPHFGMTSYIGELNAWRNLKDWDWKSFNQFNYDLGAVVRFNYDSRWAFRLDYSYAKIRARDEAAAWRPEAELNFQSTIHDIALMAEFNFLNYYTGHPQSAISPYIFAGFSGFMYNVKPFTRNEEIDAISLQQLDTDYDMFKKNDVFETSPADKKNYSFSIPFGVGCKLSLSKHLAATLEWRMHYTFTDYLDDVSGVYAPDASHVMWVATKIDDAVVEVPLLESYFPNGLPSVEYDLITGDPSELDPDVFLVYDLSDPSGKFHKEQQRGNQPTNDWFGMINLSITWKFVIPNNSACKMNIE